MTNRFPHSLIAGLFLAAFTLAASTACHSHIDVVDADGFHHTGYYDEHHDWHGGYYDHDRNYHDDPHDWHH